MYGPSPPVNPFQKASSTLGPLYSSPPPEPPWPPPPPPQPTSTNPAPAPALASRNSRRVSLRTFRRPFPTSFSSFRPHECPSAHLSRVPNLGQPRLGTRPGLPRRDLPHARRFDLRPPVVGQEPVDLLLYIGELRVAEAPHGVAFQEGQDQG